MPLFLIVTISSWVAFLFVWAVSALFAKRNLTSRAQRTGWTWRILLTLVIIGLVNWHHQRTGSTYHPITSGFPIANPLFGWLGALCSVLGIGLAIWARVHLGRNWGMPMSRKEKPELVTTGPYAYIRHPIYTGVILASLGSVLATNLWGLIITTLVTLYFSYAANAEERLMLAEFPDTYPAYVARTKKLIPFVW